MSRPVSYAARTRTFLETACNLSFQRSLLHSKLFIFHVLNDTTIPNPGLPPFYSAQFFQKIRQVHLETPLKITTMTEKQWYCLYLEDFCTMESLGERQGLLSIWNQRQSSQKVQHYLVRAELEAKVNLLRQTRFVKISSIISEKIQRMFRFIQSC